MPCESLTILRYRIVSKRRKETSNKMKTFGGPVVLSNIPLLHFPEPLAEAIEPSRDHHVRGESLSELLSARHLAFLCTVIAPPSKNIKAE
jgi:hypothetical protein